MDNKRIDYDSDEAATYRTNITGWVSSDGRFYGNDEHVARWAGCTHASCSVCGRMTPKSRTLCPRCLDLREAERYAKLEKKKWDGNTPLYSRTADEYFYDVDQLGDYLEEEGGTSDDLRLVLCEPVQLHQIESDYWCDDLPEDGELPEEVEIALRNLQNAISTSSPVGWRPGKIAAIVEENE